MRKSKSIPRPQADIELPTCPKCGERMWVAQIKPNEPGFDTCIFECPTCDNRIVKFGEYRQLSATFRR